MNPNKSLKVAVITGGHHFDVVSFHRLFRSFSPELDVYIQHMDDFAKATKETRESYDVLVFYTMLRDVPTDEGKKFFEGKPLTALQELGETSQGIVVLHHALLAYPGWPLWNDLVGIQNRQFGFHINESVTSQVVKADHPITYGISDWTMIDETYTMDDAGEGSDILITYDHPKSMKTIAWTRKFKNSRVFCYEAGHDYQTWADQGFQTILRRGILWAAGRD